MKLQYNRTNWPFKWFGYWKEYGEGYENCPPVASFIDETVNKSYEKDKLLKYLGGSKVVVMTSLLSFPSPIDGQIIKTPWSGFSLAVRTDGNWIWFDNIGYFIEHNNLVIPDAFYAEIKNRNFVIPQVTTEQIEKMERLSSLP